MNDMRSPLAIARDKWFESDSGKSCGDTERFCEDRMAPYLRNRLATAFLAGAEAQEKIDAKQKTEIEQPDLLQGAHE